MREVHCWFLAFFRCLVQVLSMLPTYLTQSKLQEQSLILHPWTIMCHCSANNQCVTKDMISLLLVFTSNLPTSRLIKLEKRQNVKNSSGSCWCLVCMMTKCRQKERKKEGESSRWATRQGDELRETPHWCNYLLHQFSEVQIVFTHA